MITKTILICSPNGHKFLQMQISGISSIFFIISQDLLIFLSLISYFQNPHSFQSRSLHLSKVGRNSTPFYFFHMYKRGHRISPFGWGWGKIPIKKITPSHLIFYITQEKAILIVVFQKYIRFLSFDRQK